MAVRYSSRNLHVKAKEAEQAGETGQAIELYQKAVKKDPMDDLAYNRLMVNYRRRKEYRKELQTIQAAIAAHLSHTTSVQQQWLKRNKKTARTAKALVKSLGLVDRKGAPVLESRQLNTWRKRLAIVRKRLKKTPAKK